MDVLRHFYAECREGTSDKWYLITLERSGERFMVRGRYGRRTVEYGGAEAIKYAGASHAEAEAAFGRTVLDRQKHGYHEAILPNPLRVSLARAGLDPARFEPLLARTGYRPPELIAPGSLPTGQLVVAGAFAPYRPIESNEEIVTVDEEGRVEAVTAIGQRDLIGRAAVIGQALLDAGLAPATFVLGRDTHSRLAIVTDVLELAAEGVADRPGAERLLLAAQVAGVIGHEAPTPVRPGDSLPAGTYLVALDRPHRPADGSASRFAVGY